MPDPLNSHVISSGPFGNVCDVYNDTGIKNANRTPVSKLWHPTVMTHKNSFDTKICKLLAAPIVKHVYHLSNRCWAKNMIAMPNVVFTVKTCTEMKCSAQHCVPFSKLGFLGGLFFPPTFIECHQLVPAGWNIKKTFLSAHAQNFLAAKFRWSIWKVRIRGDPCIPRCELADALQCHCRNEDFPGCYISRDARNKGITNTVVIGIDDNCIRNSVTSEREGTK